MLLLVTELCSGLDDGIAPLTLPSSRRELLQLLRSGGEQAKARFCPRIRWTSEDPVVSGSTLEEGAFVRELQIQPSARLLPSLTPLDNNRLLNDSDAFHFASVKPTALGDAYEQLVLRLAANVSATLDQLARSSVRSADHANEGTEQIVRLISQEESKRLLMHKRRQLRTQYPSLDTLLRDHI